MKSDIEIAQSAKMKKITEIAAAAGIPADRLEMYGNYKAKIDLTGLRSDKKGKLILVSAITPTPAGEGKTTTSVGLADGLKKIGKNVMAALREPSLGPVFGIKGGAAGGGYAQVVPMEDINLHFTGDFHAIGAANNLLAAMLDNHIFQGNELNIDPARISWKRCVDMNDRQLRHIEDGLGGGKNGVPRSDGYDITVASEIMAILCLSENLTDLRERLSKIIVAYNKDGHPVTAKDLKAHGAMAALLKDAVKPNLVQSLEGTPALIHGGPFANIAHGCNSVIATKTALKFADYVVTEAGFGADLGAEKFIDIKCRMSGLKPDCVVLVATMRALKMHGGAAKENMKHSDPEALKRGLPNLLRHISNVKTVFGLPCVVAINRFRKDSDEEIEFVRAECEKLGVKVCTSTVWEFGSEGGKELASEVVRLCGEKSELKFAYNVNDDIQKKINDITVKIYGGDGVEFTDEAEKQIKKINELGLSSLPVCMAKTQYSFSDDAKKTGAPEHFKITVRELKLCAGAGFIVALTGNVLTMPGLPKVPSAERIDILPDGTITGLF